ncbi:hypothetical protein JNUCC0626_29435 [Lentzea sp. JNUCC 0626]|uniref:hypothetical protein n=1 Tax=Lentzea sp. JNUCC 0626 TaxID=3367513 RepID=UPI0037496807
MVAALLLGAVTSSGAAASEAPAARCTAARPVVSSTETAVEARVLTGCTAGELVVFRAALTFRAHGSQCSALAEELEADPATEPQWIRVRLELTCAPGEQGHAGSQATVEMYDQKNTRATYGLSDSYAEQTGSHLWTVEFVAGLGDLPVAPDPAVQISSASAGQGSTLTRVDHQARS